ncbi:isopeptide-forming domain-containing fimbrial protein [Helcococcus ovis]|uniref:isopeptide-forming domain-containing fimbrial protein n=1 Tax=Helcococcus ovis TaxID=72026 RepID=UPI0038BB9559
MKKRIISAFLAFIMVFAMVVPIFAEEVKTSKEADAVTNTVTLHKLIMSKEELIKWNSEEVQKSGYNGTQNLQELAALTKKGIKEIKDVYFAFKYKDGNNKGKYVTIKENLGSEPIYGSSDSLDSKLQEGYKLLGDKTSETGIKFNTKGLKGQFEIVEVPEKSTYKGTNDESLAGAKAVPVEITLPLVNEEGTVLDAHVYPKNTEDKPQIDKNFLKEKHQNGGLSEAANFQGQDQKFFTNYNNYQNQKATLSATLGKKVPYEVKTKVNKGTEYGKLVWKDIMTNGLTFNKDLKILATNNVDLIKETDYKVTEDDRGFTLSLTSTGLDKVKNVTKPGKEGGQDVEFTITYSATVNGTAIVDNPEKNDISLEYGYQPNKGIEEKTVTPKNEELNLNKSWGESTEVPQDVIVTYSLKNDKGNVASVTLTKDTNGTIYLGNGITFEVGEKLGGSFKGLPEGTNYKISERVAGYIPEYKKGNTDGTVTITNKKDNDNPTPISPNEPKVVVGGKKFVKTNNEAVDSNVLERLAGAKFVVKNEKNEYLHAKNDENYTKDQNNLMEAKNKLTVKVDEWNKLTVDQQKNNSQNIKSEIDKLQKLYNEALKKASIRYEWKKDNKGESLVVLSSDSQGKFEIQGLAYGKYKLEELQAPTGYAKISDITFEVKAGSFTAEGNINYTKESQGTKDAQQVKNKKISIPQTGGIGTVIFTVAGLIIMGAAIYALKKNNQEVDA